MERKKPSRSAALLSLLGIGSVAMAAEDTTNGGNDILGGESGGILASLSDNSSDYYLTFIDLIFGGGTILSPKEGIMSELSLYYNTGILAFIGLISLYKAAMFSTHTATSGVYGGQKVSALFGSIMIALAVFMSVPLGGYSPGQYLITDIHKGGARLANTLANVGAEYINLKGGVTQPSVRYSDPLLFSALSNNLCEEVLNRDIFSKNREPLKIVKRYSCAGKDGTFTSTVPDCTNANEYTVSWDLVKYDDRISSTYASGDYNGFCGSLTVTKIEESEFLGFGGNSNDEEAVFTAKFNAEVTAVNQLLSNLSQNPLARNIPDPKTVADARARLEEWERNLGVANSYTQSAQGIAQEFALGVSEFHQQERDKAYDTYIQLSTELNQLYQNYDQSILEATDHIRRVQANFEKTLSNQAAQSVEKYQSVRGGENNHILWSQELQDKGFVTLGGFHWTVIHLNSRINSLVSLSISMGEHNYIGFGKDWAAEVGSTALEGHLKVLDKIPYNTYGEEHTGYGRLITARQAAVKKTAEGEEFDEGEATNLINWLRRFAADIGGGFVDIFRGAFSRNTDLILVIADIGSTMMIIGYLLIGIALLGKILKTASFATLLIPGAGVVVSAVLGLVGKAFAALGAFAVPMILFGGFLAVWIPLIVPMEWFTAIFGMLIIYLSALFIIPLWLGTLAFATTSDIWEGQHFRQGFVIILGLFVRLPIMVMVFFALFVLIQIAGVLSELLLDVAVGLWSDSFTGFFAAPLYIVVVSIFCWQLIARTFSLTSDLPDNIMRSLNIGQDTLGTQGDENNARSLFLGFNRQTEQRIGAFIEANKKKDNQPPLPSGGDIPTK